MYARDDHGDVAEVAVGDVLLIFGEQRGCVTGLTGLRVEKYLKS